MEIQDPFILMYPLVYEITQWIDDNFYYIYVSIIVLTKIIWVLFGVGLFVYSRQLLIHRRRGNKRRIEQGKDGFGKIIILGRVGIALDFYQVSIVMIVLGVISLFTPLPVRPQGIFYTLAVNIGVLFIAYKCYHGAHILYTSDRDGYNWIRKNVPNIDLPNNED